MIPFEEFIDQIRVTVPGGGLVPLTPRQKMLAHHLHDAFKGGQIPVYTGFVRSGKAFITSKVKEYMEQKQQEA